MRVSAKLILGGMFLVIMICSGCITTSYSESHRKTALPIHEFNRSTASGHFIVRKGVMIEQNGIYKLQFRDVLLGASRYLNIDVTSREMRFHESSTLLRGGTPVYLVQQNICCMDNDAFIDMLSLKAGALADPGVLLKKYFSYTVPESEPSPQAICIMDFSNIYTHSALVTRWESGTLVSGKNIEVGQYDDLMREIGWSERSRVMYFAGYGVYPFTVAADIVTGPFQLLGLVLFGNTMGR